MLVHSIIMYILETWSSVPKCKIFPVQSTKILVLSYTYVQQHSFWYICCLQNYPGIHVHLFLSVYRRASPKELVANYRRLPIGMAVLYLHCSIETNISWILFVVNIKGFYLFSFLRHILYTIHNNILTIFLLLFLTKIAENGRNKNFCFRFYLFCFAPSAKKFQRKKKQHELRKYLNSKFNFLK